MSSGEPTNRLGAEVIPEHYDLTIRTDLKSLSFSGTAEILLTVHSPVPSITLNIAAPLVLKSAVLSHSALKTESLRPAVSFKLDEKRERVEILFAGGEIASGQVKLGLRWDAELESSMMGYYASSYPSKGGEGAQAFYGLTQFEPTQARRAFPCFDEPSLKATYSVSLISRTGTVSLSNTDAAPSKHLGPGGAFPRTDLLADAFFDTTIEAGKLEGKTEGKTGSKTEGTPVEQPATKKLVSSGTFKDDWEITSFSKTPKVSTYLIAWANGEFEHIESSYVSPLTSRVVPMRVYATYDHIAQASLALETKVRIMPIYEKMFDLAYPLPKLDTLVASDFDAGAMENWGLITGRTSVYLFDEKKSGIASRKRVIGVQSHEVSHQWFGNIVTFAWWDNLWLNEAFATLIGEVIVIQEIEPSWKIHSSFISDHLGRALQLDALRSSHPIEMDCPDEDTIQQIFDAISYSKGASVLKMLSNMIGEKTFLHGVSLYLKSHTYGNARTADLWAGISEASGKEVNDIMYNWTNKIGFPVITVDETEEGLKLTQNRFLSTGDPTPEEDTTIWHIPLELLAVEAGKPLINHDLVLSTRDGVVPLKDVKNAVYKLNAETCGVYRTLYSDERLAKLGDEAGKRDSAFSLSDRMGLVQDAAVLASSGYSKTSGALTLIAKLANEKENLVWAEISSALSGLAGTWWDQPEDVREAINKFRRTLFGPVADRLGFEYSDSDDVDTIELRTMAISVAAACGDKVTLKEYKRRFGLLIDQNDESLIPSDLRTSIYAQSVKFGGLAEYEKALDIYRNPPTPSHKLSAMAALCAPTDADLINRTFAFIRTDEVKNQDLANFFGGLAANRNAKRQMWTFFKDNYDEIMLRFKGNFSIGSLVRASFGSLSTAADAHEVEAFFEKKDTSAYSQPLSQGLDGVRSKAKWLERDAQDVQEWLKANKYL